MRLSTNTINRRHQDPERVHRFEFELSYVTSCLLLWSSSKSLSDPCSRALSSCQIVSGQDLHTVALVTGDPARKLRRDCVAALAPRVFQGVNVLPAVESLA